MAGEVEGLVEDKVILGGEGSTRKNTIRPCKFLKLIFSLFDIVGVKFFQEGLKDFLHTVEYSPNAMTTCIQV